MENRAIKIALLTARILFFPVFLVMLIARGPILFLLKLASVGFALGILFIPLYRGFDRLWVTSLVGCIAAGAIQWGYDGLLMRLSSRPMAVIN